MTSAQLESNQQMDVNSGPEQPRNPKGDWSATFTYPTGSKEAVDMAKSILLDCATTIPVTVTVDTKAITAENAKQMMRK